MSFQSPIIATYPTKITPLRIPSIIFLERWVSPKRDVRYSETSIGSATKRPATANIATAIAPAISRGDILSSSPRLISAEMDNALMPILIISTMVAKPLIIGYFHMPFLSQSEPSQALSHIEPPGSLTASPQCSGPFIRTPSITACPPTGILLGTAIKADNIIRCKAI